MKNFKSGFNSTLNGRSARSTNTTTNTRRPVVGIDKKVVSTRTQQDLKAKHVNCGVEQKGSHVNTVTEFKTTKVVHQDTGFVTKVLMNVKMPVSSFAWSSVGGILIGVGLLSAGVIVVITSGGTAAAAGPAIFSSVCSSMGTTGILYAADKAVSGEELDWTCYATETLVSGAIALGTLGVSKGLAVAKGVNEIAKLSNAVRASASAAVQTSATVIRNSIEGRDLCDRVLDTAVAAFAGGLVSGAVGGKGGGAATPSNAVGVSNATLARKFAEKVAKGALTGGAAAAVSCATRNAIAGENIFANMNEAIAGGFKAGAISGVVSAVVLTARRVENRALHNKMFAQRMEQVAAGGVAGGFELSLWCEANGSTVIVQDPDGTCHTYGSSTAQPPIVLTYEPGDGSGVGHYTRVETDPQLRLTPAGEFTCLADALGVTPKNLADAVHTRFGSTAFRGLSDDQIHALHNDHLGGTNFSECEKMIRNHPDENVKRFAEAVLQHKGSRAELTFRRNLLARALLDAVPSNPDYRDMAYMYNDSIPPRSYSVTYSHSSINPNFSEDRTNTGFPYSGQSVEDVARGPASRLDYHSLGVFVHPTQDAVLVSNNNRSLAHHAIVSEAEDRYVWVQSARFVGGDGSNFARWQNRGHPAIQEVTIEHTRVTANPERVRYGRIPSTPASIPDHCRGAGSGGSQR